MLRFRLLGDVRLDGPDGPVTGAAVRPRPMAVLAVLAVAGSRGIPRDRLAALFWPDSTDEQARHALAQALYVLRRGTGADSLVTGGNQLRLDPAAIAVDLHTFDALLQAGDREAACALYTGPLLDGFQLPRAPDFERWLEEERAAVAARHRQALHELAASLDAAGEPRRAVPWWRALMTTDPFAVEPVLGLMQDLAASGDASGALAVAQAHTDLRRRELDLPPAPQVVSLAQSLREQADRAVVPRAVITPPAPSAESSAEPESPAAPPAPHRQPQRVRWIAAAALAVVVAVALVMQRRSTAAPVIAVGVIESHLPADSVSLARSLGDMLATHLVQVERLRVVGRARLLEIVGGDPVAAGPGGIARAARVAGAAEIIEGAIYPDASGYRLDLRRTGLDDGQVRDAISVTARDPVSLVETAVRALAATWKLAPPRESLRAVTSVSLVARRFYEEGLRAYHAGEQDAAVQFFDAALKEDSAFAMAAFYLARSTPTAADSTDGLWSRAMRLAQRATERERLLIRAWSALELNDARGLAYAETLAVRFPEDLDGMRVLGDLRFARGEFASAADAFERVVALDSAGLAGHGRCHGCDAASRVVWASLTGDSLARAERMARRVASWPVSRGGSIDLLVTTLLRRDPDVALEVARTAPSGAGVDAEAVTLAAMQYRGEMAQLESLLVARRPLARGAAERAALANRLSEVRREAGRPRAALAAALEAEAALGEPASRDPFRYLPRALALLEMGRHDPRAARDAAALFEQMAQIEGYDAPRMARHRAWMWTHAATALARAGDTARLPVMAARIRGEAQRSSYGRDHRLPAYVNGLLLEARGDWRGARDAYTAAVWSPTENMVAVRLAHAALQTGDAPQATRVLQAYLRGPLDASNQYVARWEVHRLLADAFTAQGQRDSAAVHAAWVRRALHSAEEPWRRVLDSLPDR